MKIGVTGGTGFIGQYLLKENSDENEFFVITSRADCADLYTHPNITYVTEEYDQNGFKKAFSECEAVVHLGAKRSSKEYEESILNYTDNLRVSEELFKACRELGIKNIVNISSTAVYDSTLPTPFTEKMAVAPLSNYGAMKHTIEGVAHLFNRKYGMNIKSLRIAQVMGVGERGGYMLSIFQQRCLAQEPLNVYGKGIAGREYIYVKDVAKAIMCALNSKTEKEIFNIGSGTLTSNLELAQAFCEVFENKAGYQCLTDKKEVIEYFLMLGEEAKSELGFEPDYTLKKALYDMRNILEGK
nr:NAD-dependent epimerase/dehydratase family protein [uncultured Mediterraneibacter sp.]